MWEYELFIKYSCSCLFIGRSLQDHKPWRSWWLMVWRRLVCWDFWLSCIEMEPLGAQYVTTVNKPVPVAGLVPSAAAKVMCNPSLAHTILGSKEHRWRQHLLPPFPKLPREHPSVCIDYPRECKRTQRQRVDPNQSCECEGPVWSPVPFAFIEDKLCAMKLWFRKQTVSSQREPGGMASVTALSSPSPYHSHNCPAPDDKVAVFIYWPALHLQTFLFLKGKCCHCLLVIKGFRKFFVFFFFLLEALSTSEDPLS